MIPDSNIEIRLLQTRCGSRIRQFEFRGDRQGQGRVFHHVVWTELHDFGQCAAGRTGPEPVDALFGAGRARIN